MKIFYLPDLGEGLAEAEIREWYVKPGDTVKIDQPLVSMETAKAVVDVPSPYAGKIEQLHGNVNDIIKTGSPLISYEMNEGEKVKDKEKEKQDQGSVVGKLETSEKKWDDSQVVVGGKKTMTSTAAIKAMPAARVLANELQVDLSVVTPTGPQGLITADDVKRHIDKNKTDKKDKEKKVESQVISGKTESLHGVRRVMAQTMTQSHHDVVPVTIVEDVDITHLPEKTDLTVCLLKAIVSAAKTEPALNAWFDGQSLERKLFDDVHIGLAVDSTEGLFVPVIKNAETQTDSALRQTIDHYKEAIYSRRIAPSDLQGATITLSNFGTITGRYATPIIVMPAVAILGCGRSRDAAVVRNGQLSAGKILPLSLTFDHRAATGGEATRFLAEVIRFIVSYKTE